MEKEIKFHDKQYQAFYSKKQYIACIAGVQGGKTFVGSYWAADKIEEMATDGEGLIVAPTVKILQQGTLSKFFKELPVYRQFYKEQKGQIILPDGKNIWIRSADNPYGLESMTLDWVWGDEAGLFNLMVWTILRSRTSIKRGKIFFTTTPYNMGWLYQDFYLPWKNNEDSDLDVYSWASIDNSYFPKDFFEKEKNRLSQTEFNRRYCGEFTKMEGLVYELHGWHQIDEQEIRGEYVIGGIDWGFTNPAALIVVKISDGKYYVVDEWYETGKTTQEIIEAAIRLQNKHKINRWYADSANPEKIKEANTNTGLYVVGYEKTRDSLSAGISHLRQLFKENRLLVFKKLKNILAEFESYHYPENVQEKEDPIPENNHLMDALRYAIHGYQPAKRFEPPRVKINPINRLLSIPTTREESNQNIYE